MHNYQFQSFLDWVDVVCESRPFFCYQVLPVITVFIIFISCIDILESCKAVISLLFHFQELDEIVTYITKGAIPSS